MLRWNAINTLWYRCTLPIFVLDDYILLKFSCTVHKPTIFWPNSCISYVLTYILFFFVPQFLIFFFCIAVSLPHFILFPVCSPPLSLSFPKCPSPSLSYPLFSLSLSHPLSPFPMFMLLCLNKCSSDQLAPINRLEPWSMTTSPFCGNHPSLWMICSSPLFLDSSLFLSYAACSSLLLKMVTPQSLFTLFGMLLLALYFYYWFDFCFTLILICS